MTANFGVPLSDNPIYGNDQKLFNANPSIMTLPSVIFSSVALSTLSFTLLRLKPEVALMLHLISFVFTGITVKDMSYPLLTNVPLFTAILLVPFSIGMFTYVIASFVFL